MLRTICHHFWTVCSEEHRCICGFFYELVNKGERIDIGLIDWSFIFVIPYELLWLNLRLSKKVFLRVSEHAMIIPDDCTLAIFTFDLYILSCRFDTVLAGLIGNISPAKVETIKIMWRIIVKAVNGWFIVQRIQEDSEIGFEIFMISATNGIITFLIKVGYLGVMGDDKCKSWE